MTRLQAGRTFLGLSLISASILALQVTFTRIFSITIWYHFTYLIVGLALLGGGAAGAFLAVRQWDKAKLESQLGAIIFGFSLSVLLNLLIVVLIQFDPLAPGRRAVALTLLCLALYFVALFSTFFLGGLAVASIFSAGGERAHRLYFSDLVGASIGTLVVSVIIYYLGGPGAMTLIALLLMLCSGLFGIPVSLKRWWIPLTGVLLLLVVIVSFIRPPLLPAPASKELAWAIDLVGVPEYTRWNPVARVDVLPVTTFDPSLRWIMAGGLSSSVDENSAVTPEDYPLRFVTLDGTSITALHEFDGDLSRFQFLHHALANAPYVIAPPEPDVLAIGVGGGLDILFARVNEAHSITAVELNGDLVQLLRQPYADFTGKLVDDAHTQVITAEGRGFLSRNQQQYDIITGMGVDNFAALSGGAYVLSESYIYTVEAVKTVVGRLSPEGVFAWTRQTNNPPREMLRLTGLAAEALREQGVENPAAHIAIVANELGDWATLLVARSAFEEEQVGQLRTWVSDNHFTFLHDPQAKVDTLYADYLLATNPRDFEASYPFNIFPVTDDNPFFYNYFRWTDFSLERQRDQLGDLNTRFPIGNIILIFMLVLSIITAIVFILVPLWRYKRNGLQTPFAIPTLTYFSLLGLGYIFVEIILIQRFTLFIGYPTHAITTTIFSMLFFSGIGSLIGQQVVVTSRQLRIVILVVATAVILYTFGLRSLLESLLYLSDSIRILVSVIIIAPLAFVMGMPFPTGLRQLSNRSANLIPWAWGMNGVFSVMGSVLVILISMLTNFTTSMFVSAMFYVGASLVAGMLWKVNMYQQQPLLTK